MTAAAEVQAVKASTSMEDDLLAGTEVAATGAKRSARKKARAHVPPADGLRRKSHQMALFDKAAEAKQSGKPAPAQRKPRAARRRK